MPDKLAALRHLLAASRYGATDHRAVVPLQHLDAHAVAGWLYWKLSQHKLGDVDLHSLRRIKVLADENALVLIGDSTAIDRLTALIEDLDVPTAATLSLTCLPIETTEPQRLLSQQRIPTQVEMPGGLHLDPATETLDLGKLCPVAPDFADECVVVINPYVDTTELGEMLDEGVAQLLYEPRFAESHGLGGTVTYHCEHPMHDGRSGLRLAALLGRNGLITVQVSLRCSGHPPGDEHSATVQYVAFPGQTVAVAAMPGNGAPVRMTVLVITADTIDRRARSQARKLARERVEGVRRP